MQNVNLEQVVIDLSREKWRWMSERKVDSLTDLFHEKAVFVHMGATISKDEEIEVIRSGRIQYKDVDIQEVSVRFIGTTTAVSPNTIRFLLATGNGRYPPKRYYLRLRRDPKGFSIHSIQSIRA